MNVVIYSFPACTRCKTLKIYMDQKQIKYKDILHTEVEYNGMYPHIFVDGKKISYHTFLQGLREGDIK